MAVAATDIALRMGHREVRGVLFDLDGVLVDTAFLHFEAWRSVAADHGSVLAPEVEQLIRGVGRIDACRVVFDAVDLSLTEEELRAAAAAKNNRYLALIGSMGPEALLPGAYETLAYLKDAGIPFALASASANARTILKKTGIEQEFVAIVDGSTLRPPKPDPAVFLEAAAALSLPPTSTLVVEDAVAGVQGALRAGCLVIGIGDPEILSAADQVVRTLKQIDWASVLGRVEE